MKDTFEYYLPKELIAQYPLKERTKARLMVVDRKTAEINEGIFSDIKGYLNKGDTLVLNNSKVIPARLRGNKKTGGKIEIFLLRKIKESKWEVLLKGNIKTGQECKIEKKGKEMPIEILEKTENGSYIVKFDTDKEIETFKYGEVPLPPYIKRYPQKEDETFYQTVYAQKEGSIAAPTAGLHFTQNLLNEISNKGINIVYITLHIGWASFRLYINEGKGVLPEFFEVSQDTVEVINRTLKSGKKICAVGTSTVRAIESAMKEDKIFTCKGFTDLFIEPGYQFKCIDKMITNFHLPGSTHLSMVCAFGGTQIIHKAYLRAIEQRYRFYSYGDAMMIV